MQLSPGKQHPGWYPDPYDDEEHLRWWDGESWCVQIATTGRRGGTGWVARHKVASAVVAAIVVSGVVVNLSVGDPRPSAAPASAIVVQGQDASDSPTKDRSRDARKPAKRPVTTTVPQPRHYAVARVVDGDTLALGNGERVRLLGVDAPTTGECGHGRATGLLLDLVSGRAVTLSGADGGRDRTGRLLRYVDLGRIDAGLRLIRAGLATALRGARFADGHHPREARYLRADRQSRDIRCPERTASRTSR